MSVVKSSLSQGKSAIVGFKTTRSPHAAVSWSFAARSAFSSGSKTLTRAPLLKNSAAQLAPIVPAPSKVIEGLFKVLTHRADQLAFEHLQHCFQVLTAFQDLPVHSDNSVFALSVS